jgi:hypothetical protein
MKCLSTICDWNKRERQRPRTTWNRCVCENMSSEQRRVQLLEAEVELRRLKDRVRKAMAKWCMPECHRPCKRARTMLPTEACASTVPPLIDVEWDVTAQQLVDYLCFWRHGTALGRVNMTDCLKELTPRNGEPPASKRELTLVWWDLEEDINHAVNCRAGEYDLETFRVTVADILPVYVWEAGLLRQRPKLKQLCSLMLEAERWAYRRHCNSLSELELKWDEENMMQMTPCGSHWVKRVCACASRQTANDPDQAGSVHAHSQQPLSRHDGMDDIHLTTTAEQRREQDCVLKAASNKIPASAAQHGVSSPVHNIAQFLPLSHRRKLDGSLVTEPEESMVVSYAEP